MPARARNDALLYTLSHKKPAYMWSLLPITTTVATFALFSGSLTAVGISAILAIVSCMFVIFALGSVQRPVRCPPCAPSLETHLNIFVWNYPSTLAVSLYARPFPLCKNSLVAVTGCYDRRRASYLQAWVGEQGDLGGQVLPLRLPGGRLVSSGAIVLAGHAVSLLSGTTYLGGGPEKWFDVPIVQRFTCEGAHGALVNIVDSASLPSFLNHLQAAFSEEVDFFLITVPLDPRSLNLSTFRDGLQRHLTSWKVADAATAPNFETRSCVWLAYKPTRLQISSPPQGLIIRGAGAGLCYGVILGGGKNGEKEVSGT
jgi:hypothetical protein